ncbi:MAG: DNA adenine methylase, partial [Ignavibacteriales bacterium]
RTHRNRLSNLERARRFLVQSMMAINGVFGEDKGGFSYSDSYLRNGLEARVSRWNNLPERLRLVVERLKDVRIENKDALKLIRRYLNRPATLIYIDPPYLVERVNGYNNDANDRHFHEELLNLANSAKCMIFISGYENELYTQLLSEKNGWEKKSIDTVTKDTKGKSYNRKEIVWRNKHFQEALKNNKIPIVLTEKERKLNKINPERF